MSGQTFTTCKMYSQRTKRDHETYLRESMDIPPIVGQQNKLIKFMIKVPQAMTHLDAYEKLLQCELTERSYGNEYQCVPYMYIQQNISESKMAAVRRSLCLMLTIFT